MDQTALVRVLQTERCLANAVAGLSKRQRPRLLDELRQVGGLDVFHRKEVGVADLVGVVGQDNVRMGELGGGLDLALEPANCLRAVEPFLANQLEGNDAMEPLMPGLEDLPHAAFAELFEEEVGTQEELVAAAEEDLINVVG